MISMNEIIKHKIIGNESFSGHSDMDGEGREDAYNFCKETGNDFHVINVRTEKDHKSMGSGYMTYDEFIVNITFTVSFGEFNNFHCWEEVTVSEFCDMINENYVCDI